ncbi:DUF362 domain-containing protein [candidate division KSB1 bacterium]|nr:MAG: DUF362 domain-containing protein [candidate division KSB1 bacterium]
MKNVYFKAIDSYSETEKIQRSAKSLLKKVIDEEHLQLEPYIPLKVHFGEKGNITFIASKNFEGIIEYLQEQHIGSAFIETNVLYSGSRMTRPQHIQTAKAHGFTQLPIVIADGEQGEEHEHIEINQKHFKTCKIGKEIANQRQLIVISHFKGHRLAGFGGAIKQLAMGCAARAGKLDQHANAKPMINPFSCKKCGACARYCPENAIHIGLIPRIDKQKCVGCVGCMAVCPQKAIVFNLLRSLSKAFPERLVEYALAAQKGKQNIYITFAFNITRGCDCEGHKMKPIAGDIGVFASTDPVAIDQACLDMLDRREGKKVFTRARHQLEYAENIGLGKRQYQLIEVN